MVKAIVETLKSFIGGPGKRGTDLTGATPRREYCDRLRQPPARKASCAQVGKKRDAKVVAGAVEVIGMKEIRRSLGSVWDSVAEHVLEIAEDVIKIHLGAGDASERQQDGSFLIRFASLGTAAAERKAIQISEEIKRQLLEDIPQGALLGVNHRVCELEWSECQEEADKSVFLSIAQKFERIRAETAQDAKRWREVLLHHSSVAYQPLWNARRRAVPMYRCLLDEMTGKAALNRFSALSSKREVLQTLSELDSAVLARALEDLHKMRRSDALAALVVPVSYCTINERQSRKDFLSLCSDVPEPYRELLIFELHTIPQGAPNSRIIELVHYMKRWCRSVLLETAFDEARLTQMAGLGLFGVAFDASWFSAQHVDPTLYLTRYAKLAKSVNLGTVIHGVNTAGLFDLAYRLGFDYIAGEAVAHPLETPRNAYHYTVPGIGFGRTDILATVNCGPTCTSHGVFENDASVLARQQINAANEEVV